MYVTFVEPKTISLLPERERDSCAGLEAVALFTQEQKYDSMVN
jgi:hypothetical protein